MLNKEKLKNEICEREPRKNFTLRHFSVAQFLEFRDRTCRRGVFQIWNLGP